jgi:hypothetical protein
MAYLFILCRGCQCGYDNIPQPPCSPEFLNYVGEFAKPIYQGNKPFPYITIDNFFPEELIRNVSEDFPKYSDGEDPAVEGWFKSEINVQNRKIERFELKLEPATQFLISYMQSTAFVRFLSDLTEIQGLVPDPYLYGGGMHQTLSGGHLSIHLDYNFNDQLNMWRRVNVFVYLNEDWKEEWGGDLELWNADKTAMEVSIAPIFNRLAIFTASEVSWHGHPDKMLCPPDRSRKSIALYYYTAIDGYDRPKRMTEFRPRENDTWKYEEGLYPIHVRTLTPQ